MLTLLRAAVVTAIVAAASVVAAVVAAVVVAVISAAFVVAAVVAAAVTVHNVYLRKVSDFFGPNTSDQLHGRIFVDVSTTFEPSCCSNS